MVKACEGFLSDVAVSDVLIHEPPPCGCASPQQPIDADGHLSPKRLSSGEGLGKHRKKKMEASMVY